MIVPLYYLTNVRFGGFASYTAHLVKGLIMQGHQPALVKIGNGKRSEKKLRPFTHGVGYRNVCGAEALGMLKAAGRGVITCAYWRSHAEKIGALLEAGCAIVIHDPTELHPEMVERIKHFGNSVIAIRTANVDNFKAAGIDSVFCPHPYVGMNVDVPRSKNAVAISRIDFDKHTDLIIKANELLPEDKRVEIWGEPNRMYVHHKLEKMHPDWEKHWKGRFPQTMAGPLEIAASAKFMVDMSVIAGDGDGTQYTFLEAWDAGAQLVVNKGWIKEGGGAVNENTASIVGSPEELAEVLKGEPDPAKVEAGREVVSAHGPFHTIPEFIEGIRG